MVTTALRRWFILHFVLDVVFAVPMFLAPEWTLGLFGWEQVDPVMTRTVAAALFGIGIESWLCRNEGVEVFRSMLNLKVIWSLASVLGGGWAIVAGVMPGFGWILTVLFAAFHGLWLYYWFQLRPS